MKLNGFTGTGSGKLGSSIFSVNSGVQIVRQHQPIVANPSTEKQVQQRAKMKIMTQVAAAVAPAIAIPRKGLTSPRNGFVSKNFELAEFRNDTAEVNLMNLQFTNGNSFMPEFQYSTDGSQKVVRLVEDARGVLNRVAYFVFKIDENRQISLVKSFINNSPGTTGRFLTFLDGVPAGNYIFYAYGVKDVNEGASADYENYNVQNGSDLAKLVAYRMLKSSDYVMTRTRSLEVTIE